MTEFVDERGYANGSARKAKGVAVRRAPSTTKGVGVALRRSAASEGCRLLRLMAKRKVRSSACKTGNCLLKRRNAVASAARNGSTQRLFRDEQRVTLVQASRHVHSITREYVETRLSSLCSVFLSHTRTWEYTFPIA